MFIALMMRRELGDFITNVLAQQRPRPDQGRGNIQRRRRGPRIQPPAQNPQEEICQTPRRLGRIRRPPVRLNL